MIKTIERFIARYLFTIIIWLAALMVYLIHERMPEALLAAMLSLSSLSAVLEHYNASEDSPGKLIASLGAALMAVVMAALCAWTWEDGPEWWAAQGLFALVHFALFLWMLWRAVDEFDPEDEE